MLGWSLHAVSSRDHTWTFVKQGKNRNRSTPESPPPTPKYPKTISNELVDCREVQYVIRGPYGELSEETVLDILLDECIADLKAANFSGLQKPRFWETHQDSVQP
eukprot:924451-Amphidinium_carterae.1